MAKRIGKYKITKRESEMSLRDGGDIGGTATFSGGIKALYVKGTATVSVTVAQSGKTFIVGPLAAGLAGDSIFTLPTAADGLFFRFTYVGGAADAEDFQISTGNDTNFFIGGITQLDPTDDTENEPVVYHPNLSSNSRINFLTPNSGTWAEVYCDGTNWFINAQLISATATGITFADN